MDTFELKIFPKKHRTHPWGDRLFMFQTAGGSCRDGMVHMVVPLNSTYLTNSTQYSRPDVVCSGTRHALCLLWAFCASLGTERGSPFPFILTVSAHIIRRTWMESERAENFGLWNNEHRAFFHFQVDRSKVTQRQKGSRVVRW